jgi:hypothetical protein
MLVRYCDGCHQEREHYVFFRNRLFRVFRIVLKNPRFHVSKVRQALQMKEAANSGDRLRG